MPRRSRSCLAAGFVLLLSGCVLRDVDLSGLPCPCAGDYVCDALSNACIHLVSGPFTVVLTPPVLTLGQGRSASLTVELHTEVAQSVSVKAIDLPAGVATSPGAITLSLSQPRGELLLTSDTSAPIGTTMPRLEAVGPTGEEVHQPFTLRIGGRPGTLDSSFGASGIATLSGVTTPIFPRIAVDREDRLVLAGLSSASCFVARLAPDGKLDPSFGAGGVTVTPSPSGSAACFSQDVAVQADGKVVVVGGLNPASTGFMWRYAVDGKLDASFGQGGVVTISLGAAITQMTSVAVQPDGRILLAGFRGPSYAEGHIAVLRYLPDGSADDSFGTAGQVLTAFSPDADVASDLLVLPDRRIIVAGQRLTSPPRFLLVRYSADGVLDPSFGAVGLVVGEPGTRHAVLLRGASGALLAGGTFTDGNVLSSGLGGFVTRYLDSGALDPSFGVGGISSILSAQPPSTSVIGLAEISGGGLAVFDQQFLSELGQGGSADSQFGIVAAPAPMTFTDVSVQSTGRLVAVGGVFSSVLQVVRYWP